MSYFTPDEIFALFVFLFGFPFFLTVLCIGDYFAAKTKFFHSLGSELFPDKYISIFDRIAERIKKK